MDLMECVGVSHFHFPWTKRSHPWNSSVRVSQWFDPRLELCNIPWSWRLDFGGKPPIRWEGGVKSPHRNIPVFFKTCESCLWGLWLGFVNCGLICDIRIPSFDITTLLALTTPGWLNHALRPNQSLEVLFLELGTWCEWSGLYIPIWRLCIVIWVFPYMVVPPISHPQVPIIFSRKTPWVCWGFPTILGTPICLWSLRALW